MIKLAYIGVGIFYFLAFGGFYNLFRLIWEQDRIMLNFTLAFLLAGLVIHWQVYKRIGNRGKDDSFFIIAIAVIFALLIVFILT